MNDLERGGLQYFASRACDPQWRLFLGTLADELNEQMDVEEIRAFFYVLGQRMAEAEPIAEVETLEELEASINQRLDASGWGWTVIRDVHSSLEFVHSCAPLRAAFGEDSLAWSGAILEGMYAVWLKALGAGDELQLRQIGEPEGAVDTLRFRLAHPSMFV